MGWRLDKRLFQFETLVFVYNMGMPRSSKKREIEPIIIDEEHGLVFDSENDLYSHFEREIQVLEQEFFSLRGKADIHEGEFKKYDKHLDRLLDDPDEVWEDTTTLGDQRMFIYIRRFDNGLFHVAACYLTESTPSFVYLHFPTMDDKLVERYRRGQIVFQRTSADVPMGAIDGDALHEADELAVGLYKAMLLLRSQRDIPEEDFLHFSDSREITLEDADEIWRSGDSTGNVLVSFIKEFNEDTDFWYIVVTVEDAPSNSHALLFSFPTTDKSLVDRYRHGENLQAEEVVQESSH
ncbi:MAG: PBECR2 nuclease fold domain-containing protein [Bdellovibrionales bacterium]